MSTPKTASLTPEQRLIIPADFRPGPGQGRQWVWDQVMALAEKLKGLEVVIKVNSAVRICGYDLVDALHQLGFKVFVDLKLNDTHGTIRDDGSLLQTVRPEIVTAMCTTGIKSLKALAAELPHTDILGVTVLTSLTKEEVDAIFTGSIEECVLRFAGFARDSGISGLICGPKDIATLRPEFGSVLSFNTPGIRPSWFEMNAHDQQNAERVMTPGEAIRAGALRLVVGGPILKSDDVRGAAVRTIDEIRQAVESLSKES